MYGLNGKNIINKIMNKQHTIDSGLDKKEHVNTMHDWLKTCRTLPYGTYKNNTFIPYIDISKKYA